MSDIRIKPLKGFLYSAEMEHQSASATTELSAIYHLKSRGGYSGAGIFDKDGKLLTINRGGDDKYAANGVPIYTMRNCLKQLGL